MSFVTAKQASIDWGDDVVEHYLTTRALNAAPEEQDVSEVMMLLMSFFATFIAMWLYSSLATRFHLSITRHQQRMKRRFPSSSNCICI
jgi:hypothetical protein